MPIWHLYEDWHFISAGADSQKVRNIKRQGQADLGERRRILLDMLDAVYVDTVDERRIVAIRPRPAFRPLLEVATMRAGSGIWWCMLG